MMIPNKRSIIILGLILFSVIAYTQDIYDQIKNKDYKKVRLYSESINVQRGTEPTPLMFAIYNKSDLKMIKLLIEIGADIRKKGLINYSHNNIDYQYGSCLAVAAGENRLDILKYLLSIGANIDEKEAILNEDNYEIELNSNLGWNALQWASLKGNNEIVKYLIEQGADINATSYVMINTFDEYEDFYNTPLLLAIKYNNISTAKLLIDLGADVNKYGKYTKSPLALAYQCGNSELIKLLISKSANLYNKPEMFTNNRVLLENDSIVLKHFSNEEIINLKFYLQKIDSVIVGQILFDATFSKTFTDSINNKIQKHISQNFKTLFSNQKFNINLINNTRLKNGQNPIWEIYNYTSTSYSGKDGEVKTHFESIAFKKSVQQFIKESTILNNNLGDYLKIVFYIGYYSSHGTEDFIFINPLLDRDRLYLSLILFQSTFPEYVSQYKIERDNLDKEINTLFNKYKDAIEVKY